MKNDELQLESGVTLMPNTSHTGQGIITGYLPAVITPPWPPLIQRGAEFLPVGGFSSMMEVSAMRRTFEVTITQAAYNKMMFWVLNSPGEVSGYGHVVRKGNSFLIDEVLVLEQENGHTHSFISEKATMDFLLMLRKRGITKVFRNWWHSHDDFGAFYSSVDHEQIDSLANNEFTVSVVTNKMFEPRCRVDFYRPVRYAMDHLPLKVIPDYSPERAKELQAELDAITKKKAIRRAR